jgi:RimJ/RimL family protein N-acetyltransferase
MMEIQSITLTGRLVRLEPLAEAHILDLVAVGLDESLWQYLSLGPIRTEPEMHDYVQTLLERRDKGFEFPFAVILLESNKAIGVTRYMDIQREHHTLEIGTWYGLAYQRTGVNTESKYLLLQHAFERLCCIRVTLKTDILNIHSQRAIERLGAVKEGVLRNHMLRRDGTKRDSVMYSIIDTDWPRVKALLEEKMRVH